MTRIVTLLCAALGMLACAGAGPATERPGPPAPPSAACGLGKPTVSAVALVRHPERFAGAQVIVQGYIGAERGACTEQVCPPDHPCCNCGYAPVLLERPVQSITGDTARLELHWDPYSPPQRAVGAGWFECHQDAVSCAVVCAPPTDRSVRIQARIEQEQGYQWLRVNDYCVGPDS